jgi:hypothetical protein
VHLTLITTWKDPQKIKYNSQLKEDGFHARGSNEKDNEIHVSLFGKKLKSKVEKGHMVFFFEDDLLLGYFQRQ